MTDDPLLPICFRHFLTPSAEGEIHRFIDMQVPQPGLRVPKQGYGMLGFKGLGRRLFGSANERYLKKLQPKVEAINALESEIAALDDAALKAKTTSFKERIAAGETLDDLLVEAFAVVREASKRTLGLRHFDVQLIGGMVLHDNSIAEMKTGEGKTLVATLAAYLNALSGKGVHVITVNEYLAARDADWMSQIYGFLGLTTGVITNAMRDDDRRAAYAADITYATNSELGFDYLRDNSSKYSTDDMVQRPFNFAVIDEVDSILIDEARTPLIISGPTEDKSDLYVAVDLLARDLTEEDYDKDEKSKNVTLTEDGTEKMEELLREAGQLHAGHLYDSENIALLHHVEQALRSRIMFERDTDYIVKSGKVVIIDEFTGRMMDGRRYSDGLHQALEAKEGVDIQPENQTLASITYQNYFRMYPKLSGMTGTAATEAEEFANIYKLGVVEIPTNVTVQRIDEEDEFYRTADDKNGALIAEIKDAQDRGQPVLVGTVSIEKSELLSALLKKARIKHQVLNARFHESEAQIVAQAGRLGAVTIATNMAGRGTDIQLGGNADMRLALEGENLTDEKKRAALADKIKAEIEAEKAKVLDAGGLYVIATERHDSRRIDNQLRGRSGRQGDPGRSKFFLSLSDDLMRIYGPDRENSMLGKLFGEEGEAIVHPWITKAIEKAQRNVETRNYEIRKNVVKFDDVMNDQRTVIYEQRREVMDAEDVAELLKEMRADVVEHLVAAHIPPKSFVEQWDLDGLEAEMVRIFAIDAPVKKWLDDEDLEEAAITERLLDAVERKMAAKVASIGAEFWRMTERRYLLHVIDNEWKEHLGLLELLRRAVGLRAYGQRDPLNEYKTEAFSTFESMLHSTREKVCELLSHIEIQIETDLDALHRAQADAMVAEQAPASAITGGSDLYDDMPEDEPRPRKVQQVPRNAPCPCGSGKKYKHCHGQSEGGAASESPAQDPYSNVGRNEPCPCGSGKKFKHCHGAN